MVSAITSSDRGEALSRIPNALAKRPKVNGRGASLVRVSDAFGLLQRFHRDFDKAPDHASKFLRGISFVVPRYGFVQP
jgi:hypothetical protein